MKKNQELELEGERKKYVGGKFLRCGAKDGTRTHTLSLAADFESAHFGLRVHIVLITAHLV